MKTTLTKSILWGLVCLAAVFATLPAKAETYLFRQGAKGLVVFPGVTDSALVATPAFFDATGLNADTSYARTITITNVGQHPFEFYSSYSTGVVGYLTAESDPDADGQIDWNPTSSSCKPNGVLQRGQSCTFSLQFYLWGSTPPGTSYIREVTIKGMDGETYEEVTLPVSIRLSRGAR